MTPRAILLVSTDKVFARSIEYHLKEKADTRILSSFKEKEALDILGNETVDLIMVDANPPKLDSVLFSTRIFNRSICKPLIILKYNGHRPYWKKTDFMKRFGIVEYIHKPINLEHLDQSIQSVLNHFHAYKHIVSCINFIILVSMIRMEQKTGILTINTGKTKGRLFMRGGELLDLETDGVSPQDFFSHSIRNSPREMQLEMDYVEHRRSRNRSIGWTRILPDHGDIEKLYQIPKTNKEKRMAVNENVFEGLSEISGFTAGAIYYGDGEMIVAKTSADMEPGKMGGLAVELYKNATSIVNKMGLGNANFVEVHTDNFTFVHTCIVPGVAALGVIIQKKGNIGLIKHEMSTVAKSLQKEFGG